MTDVVLSYDPAQLFLLFDVVLILVFISLGEMSEKTLHFKRGMLFFFAGCLLIFTCAESFWTNADHYWISIVLGFAGGIYFLRSMVNLAVMKGSKNSELDT